MIQITETRLKIARVTIGVSIVFAPLDAMVKFSNGDYQVALVVAILAVIYAVTFWFSKRPKYQAYPVYVMLLTLVAAFALEMPNLAQHPESAIWLPLYPFYFYSLAGLRIGSILIMSSMVYLGFIYYWNDFSSVVDVHAVAVAYLCSIFLGYSHESAHRSEHIKLERLALLDCLTESYNRHGLLRIWDGIRRHALVTGAPLSLVIFDIDNFKNINDTYGHDAGDEVLRHVSDVTRSHLRASDYLVRWGGEEFIILLPGADLHHAGRVAESVRQAIESAVFGSVGSVTCSFGVAHLDEGYNLEVGLKRADKALYQAKDTGRNKVIAYDNDLVANAAGIN